MQVSFDPLDYSGTPDEARKQALRERDAELRRLRKLGKRCYGFMLKNQLRKYWGLGQPDGRVRDVFYVSIHD